MMQVTILLSVIASAVFIFPVPEQLLHSRPMQIMRLLIHLQRFFQCYKGTSNGRRILRSVQEIPQKQLVYPLGFEYCCPQYFAT